VLASTYLPFIKLISVFAATNTMSQLPSSPTDAYVAPGKRRAHKLAQDTAVDLNFSTGTITKTFDPRRFENDPDEVNMEMTYEWEERQRAKADNKHHQTNGVVQNGDLRSIGADDISPKKEPTSKRHVHRDPKYKQDLHEWRALKKEHGGMCHCAWHSGESGEKVANFDQCLYQMEPFGYKPNPDALVLKMTGDVRRILFQREFRFTLDWKGAGKHV
jgi:hypothetical protein